MHSESGITPQTNQTRPAKLKNYQKPLPTPASRNTISKRSTTKLDVRFGQFGLNLSSYFSGQNPTPDAMIKQWQTPRPALYDALEAGPRFQALRRQRQATEARRPLEELGNDSRDRCTRRQFSFGAQTRSCLPGSCALDLRKQKELRLGRTSLETACEIQSVVGAT